ncbi:hypothetical protein GCM10023210_40570 [Chryseobacterium ginsengisoli]|uniref:SHOCT domain-containing protein n=1 Tax=Chryseobacterium ginsengisoli TaxID=363853 RepID=A0ABP9MWD8_9FLAO
MTNTEAYNQRLLEIKRQIGNIEVPVSPFLMNGEFSRLPDVLDSDEKIIHAVTGNWEGRKQGLLVATDKKLIFLAYGIFNSFEEIINYSVINSISCNPGVFYADISIFTSEKNILIENVNNKKNALSFCNKMDEILSGSKKGESKPINSNQNSEPDIMDQLKKLGELREKGILTDQEFTEQKKKLLDKL